MRALAQQLAQRWGPEGLGQFSPSGCFFLTATNAFGLAFAMFTNVAKRMKLKHILTVGNQGETGWRTEKRTMYSGRAQPLKIIPIDWVRINFDTQFSVILRFYLSTD